MASANDSQHVTFPASHTDNSPARKNYDTDRDGLKRPQHTSTPKKGNSTAREASSHCRTLPGAPDASPVHKHGTVVTPTKYSRHHAASDGHPRWSPARSPENWQKLSIDMDNSTINRQRHELDLLIGELRDRDQELNDMVAAHQKQLMAWDSDRQRILSLEQKSCHLEGEVHWKTEQLQSLIARLREIESHNHSKSTALETTQQQLVTVCEQQNNANIKVRDMAEKNKQLLNTLQKVTSRNGQLEAKEKELLAILNAKDKELSEASSHIAELTARLKSLDGQHKESIRVENLCKREVQDWKRKHSEGRKEIEKFKSELHRNNQREKEHIREMDGMREEVRQFRKDLTLAYERDRRKQELFELQKSKMERTESELNTLRQLYERQQRDLSLLHLNLESTKELVAQQQNTYLLDQSAIFRNELNSSSLQSYLSQSPISRVDMSSAENRKLPDNSEMKSKISPSNCVPTETGKTLKTTCSPDGQLNQHESSFKEALPDVNVSPLYSPMGNRLRAEGKSMDDSFSEMRYSSIGSQHPFISTAPTETTRMQPSQGLLTANMEGSSLYGYRDISLPSEPNTPTSKLHKLLMESREMVRSLERSTFNNDQKEEYNKEIRT